MVARGGAPYRSANAGELSPLAAGRADIKQFYSAGLRFKNVQPVPLSGFRAMDGSRDVGRVRGRVAELAQSAVTVTAGPHAAGTATLWQATIDGAVCAIGCSALAADTGSHVVQAQALVAGTWTNLGAPLAVGTAVQAMAFAVAPGGALTATAVRLQATLAVLATITAGTVTVLSEGVVQDVPRYSSLRHDEGNRYDLSLQAGFLDIYEDDAFVAGVVLPEVTVAILPEVNFYAENATLGIAHRDLETLRVRRAGTSQQWTRGLWPYDGLPMVDLGGTYATTDDEWTINVTYTSSVDYVSLQLVVDGEATPALPFVDAANAPVDLTAAAPDLTLYAANIKAALEALPSLGTTITVTATNMPGKNYEIKLVFGGALSGSEYQVVSTISNTANAAALASHTGIGRTDYEPLISAARGWPGVFGLAQERLAYGDFKAVPAAIGFSQAGEYFKLNLEIAGPGAPRLDKLRAGQVAARVLGFAEATYFLAFTDRAVHFASNRTINKTDPLNFVQSADTGIVPNCEPVSLENKVYYVGVKPKTNPPVGHQVLSLSYSELETSFDATPESLLAGHLVEDVIRCKGQPAESDADASKLWLMRQDGRLVAACILRSQEVLGFCEWVLAATGAAREIHVNGNNDMRLCVARGGVLRHERMDPDVLFQGAIAATADLAGAVAGLGLHEGRAVWVEAGGYVDGPFTVTGGAIQMDASWAGPVTVGLWQTPVWESMPRYFITRNDEIVKRPGRIHTAVLELLDSSSVAVGANGQPPEDVPLAVTGDTLGTAPPRKSGLFSRSGMLGSLTGTTLVVTQVRPGFLHVRDITIEERL